MPDIILNDNIYYANSIEFLASCTELEGVSAKNIVNLIMQKEGKFWEKNIKTENKKTEL